MAIIALNLYSLRAHCGDVAAFDQTIAKLKKIGYPAVQLSGVPNVSPEDARAVFDKYGIRCVACHESLAQLRSDFPAIVKKLKTVGADFTALGSPGGMEPLAPENFPAFVKELDDYAVRFAAEGIRFGYHNHAFEFMRRDGAALLDHIYAGAPHLSGEPDTHWVQKGGGDPVAWIEKLAGRLPAVHLKDYVWRDNEGCFAEVGHGNLDWNRVLAACVKSGAEYYIVEQDSPTPGRDHFDSVAMSYDFLKTRVK